MAKTQGKRCLAGSIVLGFCACYIFLIYKTSILHLLVLNEDTSTSSKNGRLRAGTLQAVRNHVPTNCDAHPAAHLEHPKQGRHCDHATAVIGGKCCPAGELCKRCTGRFAYLCDFKAFRSSLHELMCWRG